MTGARQEQAVADARESLLRRAARCMSDALSLLNGDAAYARYLAHFHAEHAGSGAQPLDRRAYFRAETERRWNGIRRCC